MHVVALGLHGLEEFAESLVVFVDDKVRFGYDDATVFKVDKAMRSLEMEIHLLWIEKMEHRDVVLAEAKVLESVGQFLGLDEEVGENDDESALLGFLGDLVERVNESGFAGRLDVFECFENVLQLGGASARWDFEVKFFATTRESCGVALVDDEVG